ncbi:MAG: hypothetical protein WBN72_09495 [Nitrososphaeraceae archaeon]
MFRKNLALGIGLGILTIVSIAIPIQNLGWAAPIKCDVFLCIGTTGDDMMIGNNSINVIDGKQGNDNINGQGSRDDLCGGAGNDKINGGEGDDRLFGDYFCKSNIESYGADTLSGGPGNDILVHGDEWSTDSDGNKDFLDCGSGQDTVYANLTIDHDVATNCEQINPP